MLEKAAGPECPRCGCNDTEMVDAGRRGMYLWSEWQCGNDKCSHTFKLGNRTDQPRRKAQCPHCGEQDTRATGGTAAGGQVAWRNCNRCGKPFKDIR